MPHTGETPPNLVNHLRQVQSLTLDALFLPLALFLGVERLHHIVGDGTRTAPQPKQALDPDTRAAAKNIFKLIQAIHHREIIDHAISTNTPPVGMNRQVNRLMAFIKPASPTEEFCQQVAANTQT